MLVEAVHDLAAAQSYESRVIQLLIGALDDLVAASATFHASLSELETWAATLRGDRDAGVMRGEQRVSGRLALREQAHQLEHHADELQNQARRLRGKAESLTERASALIQESRRLVGHPRPPLVPKRGGRLDTVTARRMPIRPPG